MGYDYRLLPIFLISTYSCNPYPLRLTTEWNTCLLNKVHSSSETQVYQTQRSISVSYKLLITILWLCLTHLSLLRVYTFKYWVSSRAGGAGAAGAALAAPLLNSNIISSMGRGSAEPPKILLPYLQWPPHFSWASDAPGKQCHIFDRYSFVSVVILFIVHSPNNCIRSP